MFPFARYLGVRPQCHNTFGLEVAFRIEAARKAFYSWGQTWNHLPRGVAALMFKALLVGTLLTELTALHLTKGQ